MGAMRLTAKRVNEIFRDCLFKDDEDRTKVVTAEGIRLIVTFHPERLEGHRKEIEALLSELPENFKASSAGQGMSFLDAYLDKYGKQWTDLHTTMEELFLLGIALGKVEFLLPRERWSLLPGGMPYLVVK